MSESNSVLTSAVPVGNLKNRIENNLKLSIPKPNLNFNGLKNHPSTAPAISGRNNQFSDLTVVKNLNLMKPWEHENMNKMNMGHDEYFMTSPGSTIGTPSLKRKTILRSIGFCTNLDRTFSLQNILL